MSHRSSKLSATVVVPRSVPAIVALGGGLALFLFVVSQVLISNPVGGNLGEYFLGADRGKRLGLSYLTSNGSDVMVRQHEPSSSGWVLERGRGGESVPKVDGEVSESEVHGAEILKEVTAKSPAASIEMKEGDGKKSRFSSDGVEEKGTVGFSNLSLGAQSSNEIQKVDSVKCDLLNGKWIYDPAEPLYTNTSCPFITQMQNCQGNGRPDKEYENWRWKPDQCELPRFDGRKFLEMMKDKTLAYVGDSVARNQFESLLCILSQVEIPRNRGSRQMQRWHFKSTNTFIARIWSSWLVHQSNDALQFGPKEVVKVHLDIPDENFMEHLPKFDVVVLSSGHWFAKQSAYVLNNTVIGGQLWWPKEAGPMRINNVEAFGISTETTMTAIAQHPTYKGLVFLRTYSPDHYEGGAWNTGGSCTGKTKPADKIVRNEFTDVMHKKQVNGFWKAVEKAKQGTKLMLMDITEAFSYRYDGHPGPYRSTDPNKVTKRGADGKPPPQDCLHWCMPGPVDTWNEILGEMIRREFQGSQPRAF